MISICSIFHRDWQISNNVNYFDGFVDNGSCSWKCEHQLYYTICQMWFKIINRTTRCFILGVILGNRFDIVHLGFPCRHLGSTKSVICGCFWRIFLFLFVWIRNTHIWNYCTSISRWSNVWKIFANFILDKRSLIISISIGLQELKQEHILMLVNFIRRKRQLELLRIPQYVWMA